MYKIINLDVALARKHSLIYKLTKRTTDIHLIYLGSVRYEKNSNKINNNITNGLSIVPIIFCHNSKQKEIITRSTKIVRAILEMQNFPIITVRKSFVMTKKDRSNFLKFFRTIVKNSKEVKLRLSDEVNQRRSVFLNKLKDYGGYIQKNNKEKYIRSLRNNYLMKTIRFLEEEMLREQLVTEEKLILIEINFKRELKRFKSGYHTYYLTIETTEERVRINIHNTNI